MSRANKAGNSANSDPKKVGWASGAISTPSNVVGLEVDSKSLVSR